MYYYHGSREGNSTILLILFLRRKEKESPVLLPRLFSFLNNILVRRFIGMIGGIRAQSPCSQSKHGCLRQKENIRSQRISIYIIVDVLNCKKLLSEASEFTFPGYLIFFSVKYADFLWLKVLENRECEPMTTTASAARPVN